MSADLIGLLFSLWKKSGLEKNPVTGKVVAQRGVEV
jgi:hypothetical protein